MDCALHQYRNFIGGTWRDASSLERLERYSPSDGELISIVESSSETDVREAAFAAREALDKQEWAFQPRKRSIALHRWARRIRSRQEELARLLALEAGKPIREARGELAAAVNYLEYYAGAARTLYGSSTAVHSLSYSILAREPVGVVAVIVPWNFPITLMMRALAPALAAGNAAIVKPAEYTSAVTMACIELAADIEELPPGILNAVTGIGSLAGMQLVRDPGVEMVSFTGGSVTGKTIMAEAAQTMKKLSLELGGKSAHILFDDADLDKALPFALNGIFANAGQLCTVGSRLLVQERIYDQAVERLKEMAERLRAGHVLDELAELGPVAADKQLRSVMRYIEAGKREGELITGGVRLTDGELGRGFYVAPTIFAGLPNHSPVVQEEIFGPVLSIQPFRDDEEAISLANSTVYGLAAGLWSRDINRAMNASRKLKAGTVWVNTFYKLFPEAETGGFKESGIGRASGVEGLLEYTEIKHVCVEYE